MYLYLATYFKEASRKKDRAALQKVSPKDQNYVKNYKIEKLLFFLALFSLKFIS